jgi:nitroreductase
MQNMVLQAHALGLGACWLTFRQAMKDRIRQRLNIPEDIEIITYFDVGFPAQAPMAPTRIKLKEAIIARV